MKKKKPDSIVWDNTNDSYFAKILPYSSSLSGPIIRVPNVDAFKKRSVDKVSKLFRAELSDLQAKIESFVSIVSDTELVYNSEIKFALKGKMDRVQEEDGVLHVLDYKTGNVEPNKLTFTDNEDIIQSKKTNIIQLACYNLIVSSILNSNKPFKSGIISFKHINQGTLWMKEKISFKERKDVFNEKDTFYAMV